MKQDIETLFYEYTTIDHPNNAKSKLVNIDAN